MSNTARSRLYLLPENLDYIRSLINRDNDDYRTFERVVNNIISEARVEAQGETDDTKDRLLEV